MTKCVECARPPHKQGSHLCIYHLELAKRDLFRDEKPEVVKVAEV